MPAWPLMAYLGSLRCSYVCDTHSLPVVCYKEDLVPSSPKPCGIDAVTLILQIGKLKLNEVTSSREAEPRTEPGGLLSERG